MVESMSRCLAFAEGVVTMVCPLLLALALKKIKWKGEMEEPVVPMIVLLIAGVTLVTGICPLLACCVSERFPTACVRLAHVTRRLAAPFSSACLLALACWISLLIVPVKIVIPIGFMFGLGIVARLLFRSSAPAPANPAAGKQKIVDEEKNDVAFAAALKQVEKTKAKELHTILDKSHELLSGVTGILFLGLQGLALEGVISTCHGIQDAVRTPMEISFFFCAFGVYLMFLAMIYPLTVETTIKSILSFTVIFDLVMVVGTVAILATIMNKLMGLKGLLFFSFPMLIFFQLAYRLLINSTPATSSPSPSSSSSSSSPSCFSLSSLSSSSSSLSSSCGPSANDTQGERTQEDFKAAPMGLTKVTFTGFLAVSVTSISSGSTNEWTDWFLLFAAAAISSGLSWRLLTHTQNKKMAEAANEAANVASFCTHFCIAVATVLFTVMAWEAANKVHVTTCAYGNGVKLDAPASSPKN